MWGQSNSHLRAAQSSNALRTVAQSPKEPLPQTVLHPPMAQGWMWFPHNKGICLMKQWKLTEENVSVAVEAVLCANTTLLPREVLNAGWHRAASPVSKFRISSHPTPEIINSGSCSQPLPLICGVCSAFLSTVTQKLTVLCPLVFLQQTFLHRNQLLLLGPNISSHTWSASNVGNSLLRNFFKSQWIAMFSSYEAEDQE